MTYNRKTSAHQSAGQRRVRRLIFGFGWFTIAAVGALLVVGSVAVTVVSAWVRLGQQASDLNGPDTATDAGQFFAAAFRDAYGGFTLPVLLALCGIVLFLTGVVGGVLGVLSLRRMRSAPKR